MHIYVPQYNKYLSHELKLVSKKSEKTKFHVIKSGEILSLKIPKGKFLSFETVENNEETLRLKLKSKGSQMGLFKNKYLYVLHNSKIFILTFEPTQIFFSSNDMLPDDQRRIELIRDEGVCSTSIFHNNNYRGIITDLLISIPVSSLDRLLELKWLYNAEDNAKKNILEDLNGNKINSLLQMCEPCGAKSDICRESLGIILSPQMYGNTKLTKFSTQNTIRDEPSYNPQHCVLHFSPDLLEGIYYHINTTNNSGFLSEKSMTDSNIKKITPDIYYNIDVLSGSKNYAFRNYELVVRKSIPTSFLRHVTFFNIESYNANKSKLNLMRDVSCSFV